MRHTAPLATIALILTGACAPTADDGVEVEGQAALVTPFCGGSIPSELRGVCCPGRDTGDGDRDGLPDACEDALAERYAPIVYHSSDESNFPVNVDWLLPRTALWFYDDGCTPDWKRQLQGAPSQDALLAWNVRGGCGSSDTVFSSGTRSNRKQRTFFLSDVGGGDRGGSRNSLDWRTYVHAYPNNLSGVTVQYWRVYAYNDAANDHGGDWEGQFLILDRNLQPHRIGLMGHTSIDEKGPWEFTWEGTHPRVFSEGGGHATRADGSGIAARGCGWFFPCRINPGNPATFVRQESWSWGVVRWPDGSATWNGGLLNVGAKQFPLNGQVFIGYSGLWGSPGSLYGTSGYWGPAYNETGMSGNFMTAWCYGMARAPGGECSPAATSR